MNLLQVANKTIPLPENKKLFYKEGDTGDIMHEVLNVYKHAGDQLKDFAPFLRGSSVYDTCSTVWKFVKTNIDYKIDPVGMQWVKTPDRVWADKECDCKSYSIFIASLLKGLGIKGAFRFVSFSADPQPTHVYMVVKDKGKEIRLDCVTGQFDYEVPYRSKHDYNMSKIYELAGIIESPGMQLPVVNGAITAAALSAAILKERLELEKGIYARNHGAVSGIGQVLSAHDFYIDQLNTYLQNGDSGLFGISGIADDVLAEVTDPAALPLEQKRAYLYDTIRQAGISNNACREASILTKRLFPNHDVNNDQIADIFYWYYDNEAKAKGLDAKFKIINPLFAQNGINVTMSRQHATFFQGVKKVLTTVAKVVTAPIRLIAKGILELTLPAAGPNFIYLFISDPAIIAKLPEAVKAKRDKQSRKADFICDVIGMSRDHFMGIMRNGIMKHLGASPEDYIAKELKNLGIAGIGVLPFAAIVGVGKFLVDLMKKLVGLFSGKKDPVPDEEVAPSPDDWNAIEPGGAVKVAANIEAQPNNVTAIEKIALGVQTTNEAIKTILPVLQQAQNNSTVKPSYTYNADGTLSDGNGGTLPPVIIQTNPGTNAGNIALPPKKDNTMMYVGLAAVAYLLLKKK